MNKKFGFIMMIAGLLGVSLLFEPVKKVIKLSAILPAKWSPTDTTLTLISIGLIIVGFFIIRMNRNISQGSEVPIYRGKVLVGYRKVS